MGLGAPISVGWRVKGVVPSADDAEICGSVDTSVLMMNPYLRSASI